jgi:hypothetical protein
MFNKLVALAITGVLTVSGTAILSTLSIISAPLTSSANAQAQRYKVTFWYVINNSDDGPLDNTLELHGTLMAGGTTIRYIDRASPQSKEKGHTLHIGSHTTTNRSILVNATLTDRDDATSDDRVFFLDNGYNLNLENNVGKQIWRRDFPDQATLYMYVEKVK